MLAAIERSRRFIPARAGNTSLSPAFVLCTAVHPRASGEHVSVRVRPLAVQRFIPARAGNTGGMLAARLIKTVHPRASGEHCGQRRIGFLISGSSPRERGTRL